MPDAPPAAPEPVSTPPIPAPASSPAARTVPLTALWVGIAAVIVVALSASVAWNANQRSRQVEQQLVARQQQSQTEATEALLLARQSQDSAREISAKMALLEARVAEATVQRSQLDELIQSFNRSRDENLLADVEAALRVAQQQSALTGSPEPLISTLKQADERLARYNQPRLERVRRAVLRDLERVSSVAQVDVPSLVIRIDEVVRQVDDLPLAGVPARSAAKGAGTGATAATGGNGATAATGGTAATGAATPTTSAPATSPAAASPAAASPAGIPTASGQAPAPWWQFSRDAANWGLQALSSAWQEVRGLVRLTRIDNPEALLAAPEQVFFLRENLKLRLLNARLALLSRQFDLAQSDLRDAQRTFERYFDVSSRRVVAAQDLLKQIAQQSRQVTLPRPEETLAALASVNAGR